MTEPERIGGAASRAALTALQDALREDLGALGVLRAFGDRRHELDTLQLDLSACLERASRAAVICLVGSTGAGKSTLLNALVGRAVAREGVDRPTTSAPVVYRPVDADVSGVVAGLPGVTPEVVTYDPSEEARAHGDRAFWRGQVIIDAPDVNSVETVHRDVVRELAARSDVLVVVAHRQSIAELSSATFVDLFAERRGMVFVLGRRDELEPGAEEALVGQLSELRDERWKSPDAPIVTLSARLSQTDPEAGGVRALQAELFRLIQEEKLGTIRRQNALGDVARIARAVETERPNAAASLRALDAALERGADAWTASLLGAVEERLELRRADLAQLLWNDAAKAWDGPGGYALKVGGLSAIGLGAGAAVVRRNPVLAAGLAVGTVAADRVRTAVRERQVESTSGLLPAASDVESVQRDAFRDARLAAADLFAPGKDAGASPDGPELDACAARAVDESWERMLRVDLPRAAQDQVGRGTRLFVDLPVYAPSA
ncbi:MAG: dynamin family protein [Planctomycetota bacterium]